MASTTQFRGFRSAPAGPTNRVVPASAKRIGPFPRLRRGPAEGQSEEGLFRLNDVSRR